MSKIDDGGPALPWTADGYDHPGISLRDYFAGQALPTMIAHAQTPDATMVATNAYMMADALIAAKRKAERAEHFDG